MPQEHNEGWGDLEEIDGILGKFFPENMDVSTLDGDSRSMKERLLDAFKSIIQARVNTARLEERKRVSEEIEKLPIHLVGTHPLNALKSVDEAVLKYEVLNIINPKEE